MEYTISDHKPVSSIFTLQVGALNEKNEWKLDIQAFFKIILAKQKLVKNLLIKKPID